MSEVKTLNQLREEKKKEVGIPLSDKEQDEVFKKWLIKKQMPFGYTHAEWRFILQYIKRELLVEFEE